MKNLSRVLIISTVYLVSITLLMNSNLARDTLFGNYQVSYKIQIFISLISGMWTSMSGLGFFLLILTALLTGINLTLLVQKAKELKQHGNLRIIVSGSSLLGIMGSGCAACGLPILALLGLGGVLGPLGFGLSYLGVLMLLVSFYLLIKIDTKQSCKI